MIGETSLFIMPELVGHGADQLLHGAMQSIILWLYYNNRLSDSSLCSGLSTDYIPHTTGGIF